MTAPTDPQPPFLDGDRPHRPADDREEVYFEGSPQIRGELGRLMLCWIIGLMLIGVPFFLTSLWWVILAGIVLGLFMLVLPVILARTVRYRISNYRIDYERGILSRNLDTLELWHVDDISLHQSLLNRILRVGTITIISNDETSPKLSLQSLPAPRPIFDALKQRIIAVKRQRGVIKMDVG